MARATPRGFDASVDLVDERGTDHGARAVHTDAACRELLDVVALGIAIAIDPQSLMRRTRPAPAGAPASPAPSATAPPASSPGAAMSNGAAATGRSDSSAPSEPVEGAHAVFWESAGAVASTGVAPRPTAGLSVGAASRWGSLSLGVEARVDAPVSAAAASSWLAQLAVVTCAYSGRLLFCALGEAGSMQASGELLGGRSTSIPWLAAGGRFGVDVPLDEGTMARLRSDVAGTFRPPSLQVNGTTVWQAPWVSTSLGVDLVVHFR
jgi:hypothetical protein